MKYLYLFFIFLLVSSDCPNLCSGHGTCSEKSKCVCNTQPGLGLNKGAFDEFSWTGTCPKGQSFSYDIFQITPDAKQKNEDLKFIKEFVKNGGKRLLFESDNGRQAADVGDADESTPTQDEPTTVRPTTAAPTTLRPTTAEPTTVRPTTAPTTPGPTTTAPEIITQAPVVVTPPPVATLPPEELNKTISESKLMVNQSNTVEVPENLVASKEVIVFDDQTGEIIGKVKVTDNKTVEEVLNQLGITDVSNVKMAEKKKTVAETTPTINFAEEDKVYRAVVVDTTTGKTVQTVAVKASKDIKNKLKALALGINRRRMLFDEMRMLGDTFNCSGTVIPKDGAAKMWCVESEDPKDSNYFKMKLLDLTLKCYKTKSGTEGEVDVDDNGNPKEATGDSCTDCDVFVTGAADQLEDINSACFYLGDENAKIEDSDLFSMVGERGGDYYFSKFTESSTVIVATLKKAEDGQFVVDYTSSPSLVDDTKSYKINRPIGDIQKSVIPGGKMIVTEYNPKSGKLSEPTTVVIDKGGISEDGKLIIEVPKAVDMNSTSPSGGGNDNEDTITEDDDETDTPPANAPRELFEERELDTNTNVVILQFVEYPPHAFIECSGQGNCNRQTGQCECYEGFEGDACQRTSCPNNCNNNGRCVVLNEALGFELSKQTVSQLNNTSGDAFTKSVSEPFDSKIFGCICDEGHRGPDCSLYECPSTTDPSGATNIRDGEEYRDCSGRGVCDYDTGTCTCFEGYYGTACENMASFI